MAEESRSAMGLGVNGGPESSAAAAAEMAWMDDAAGVTCFVGEDSFGSWLQLIAVVLGEVNGVQKS